MPDTRLTIDEFLAALPAEAAAFAAATRQHQAEGDEGFTAEYQRRTFADWIDELRAYCEYVSLQEVIAHDRRTLGTIERRRPQP